MQLQTTVTQQTDLVHQGTCRNTISLPAPLRATRAVRVGNARVPRLATQSFTHSANSCFVHPPFRRVPEQRRASFGAFLLVEWVPNRAHKSRTQGVPGKVLPAERAIISKNKQQAAAPSFLSEAGYPRAGVEPLGDHLTSEGAARNVRRMPRIV